MAAVEEVGGILRSRVHARIGLLGNPSDGFNGSCISLSLKNFHAEVGPALRACSASRWERSVNSEQRWIDAPTRVAPSAAARHLDSTACHRSQVMLTPSPTLRLQRNPECDASQFDSLGSVARHLRGWGYNGGVRLLQAMCKRFYEHCRARDIPLPLDAGNFTLSYTTTIPRQVTCCNAWQLSHSARPGMCSPAAAAPPQPCAPACPCNTPASDQHNATAMQPQCNRNATATRPCSAA